jgi:hypothetical protein
MSGINRRKCCCGSCLWAAGINLVWSGTGSAEPYGQVDSGAVCYYGSPTNSLGQHVGDNLVENIRFAPVGGGTNTQINGSGFTTGHTVRFWVNTPSGPVPTIVQARMTVANTGGTPICVNGTTVPPGSSWEVDPVEFVAAGGDQSGYGGGTVAVVACGECGA